MRLQWSGALKNERPPKYEMTEYLPRSADGYRRVEPIFDASGALKRHTINRNEPAKPSLPREKTGSGE